MSILRNFSCIPPPKAEGTLNAVSVQIPETDDMWQWSLSISARTVRMCFARIGISHPDSMISEYAMQFATQVSPEILSTSLELSCDAGVSRSFSTPRCVYPRAGFNSITGSPATLNLKCPGSIMPACTGPTGISNTSSPTVRLDPMGILASVDLS